MSISLSLSLLILFFSFSIVGAGQMGAIAVHINHRENHRHLQSNPEQIPLPCGEILGPGNE